MIYYVLTSKCHQRISDLPDTTLTVVLALLHHAGREAEAMMGEGPKSSKSEHETLLSKLSPNHKIIDVTRMSSAEVERHFGKGHYFDSEIGKSVPIE